MSASFANVSMSTGGEVLRRKFWLHKSLWWNNSESHRNNPCVRISFDSNHIVIVVVTFCNQERHILDTYIMASPFIRAKMSGPYVKFLDSKLESANHDETMIKLNKKLPANKLFWKPSLETRYVVRIFFNSAKKHLLTKVLAKFWQKAQVDA